jgi:hypothetical protein
MVRAICPLAILKALENAPPYLPSSFLSDICGYGRILRESTASDPITVSGFGQTTCYDLHYAGYVSYSIPEESCPAVRKAIGDSCCVDYYKSVYCKVCDYGYVSTIDEEAIGCG